jgi:hypothetical protein
VVKKKREMKIVGNYVVHSYNYLEQESENSFFSDSTNIFFAGGSVSTISAGGWTNSVTSSYDTVRLEFDFNSDGTWEKRFYSELKSYDNSQSNTSIVSTDFVSEKQTGVWEFLSAKISLKLAILESSLKSKQFTETSVLSFGSFLPAVLDSSVYENELSFDEEENVIYYDINLLEDTEMGLNYSEKLNCKKNSCDKYITEIIDMSEE